MYSILISIKVGIPGKRKKVLDLLHAVCGPTSSKRGCSRCSISLEYEDEDVINYSECWDSLEALSRHIQSTEFWNVFLAIDMGDEEPVVRLDEVASTTGLETLRQMRTANVSVN